MVYRPTSCNVSSFQASANSCLVTSSCGKSIFIKKTKIIIIMKWNVLLLLNMH